MTLRDDLIAARDHLIDTPEKYRARRISRNPLNALADVCETGTAYAEASRALGVSVNSLPYLSHADILHHFDSAIRNATAAGETRKK